MELPNCFCGSDRVILAEYHSEITNKTWYWGQCLACGVSVDTVEEDSQAALGAWEDFVAEMKMD